MSDKTEEATPRRLRKAAEEGDVPVSAALSGALAFWAALALAPAALSALWAWAGASLRRAPSLPPADAASAGAAALDAALNLVRLAAPVLAAAAAVAALAGFVQGGGTIAWKKLTPDLSRLSPAKGLRSLASPQRLSSVVRSIVTAAATLWVGWSALRDRAPDLAASIGSPSKALPVAADTARRLARDVGLVLLTAALVDVGLTRHAWKKRLRMSKDEVKREHKESEGDPHIKAARERAHHELLAQASIHAVKNATVVVVNPHHRAAALRYREGDDEAPTLVSKGEGAFAAQIIEAARAYGVPVVQDVPLARALLELEIGEEIPEALYEAVAEVLRALWEHEEAVVEGADEGPPARGRKGANALRGSLSARRGVSPRPANRARVVRGSRMAPRPLPSPPPARPRTRRPAPAARPLALAASAAPFALAALAALACGESGDKGGPAPAPTRSAQAPPLPSPSAPSAPALASAPAAAASALPLGRRLTCERLLPEAARDRLVPGYALRQGAQCPDCGPDCTFTHPTRPYEGVQASYVCNEAFDAKRVKALTDPLRASLRKGGAIKGFGRGGVHGEKEFGTFYTVLAFDDDSDCRVTVDWMRGDRDKALGLAKLALEGVKQADVRGPSPHP